MEEKVKISVVVPVMNEEENIPLFYKELIDVLQTLGKRYEILFIDDGSTDASLSLLKELAKKDSHVRVFSFRKNLGKSEALSFGFSQAKGEYIATLDADLQDKPSELPKFFQRAEEGVEVVSGWKKDRKDKSYMVFISRMFNGLINKLFNMHIHDYNCGYKLYTREAAKSLRLYGGLYRFIPLLAAQQGFIVDEIPVEHQARKYGKSKYGFSKLWKNIPDIFTILFLIKFNKRPLHFFGTVGGILLFVGMCILFYLWIIQLQGESIGRRPLLFVGFFSILSGLQILFTGFLADLMIHLNQNAQVLDESKLPFPIKYNSDITS